MAPIVGETGHIFAVDIDASALEDLHKNLGNKQITNVTPVYSVPENPMLPSRVLDAVLIRNTYHEFTSPMSILGHVKRALKPGGRLVIAEPIDPDLKDESRERQAQSHDISMDYVRDDLKKAGFTIVRSEEHFSDGHPGDQIWLIIAVPISSK
jgi:ubiquinone/menaquinone biosynthesis C-methylase UbiE